MDLSCGERFLVVSADEDFAARSNESILRLLSARGDSNDGEAGTALDMLEWRV
jgi:hypothetical protein